MSLKSISLIEKYKLKQDITTNGEQYEIKRNKRNSYNERTNELEHIVTITALFHTTYSHVTESRSDGTTTHSKRSPSLLVMWEDVEKISIEDFVVINDQMYKIVSKQNVGNLNLCCELSLEVVLDGKY